MGEKADRTLNQVPQKMLMRFRAKRLLSSEQLFRLQKHPAEPRGSRPACRTLERHFTGTVSKGIAHRLLSNSSDGIGQWPNLNPGGQSSVR